MTLYADKDSAAIRGSVWAALLVQLILAVHLATAFLDAHLGYFLFFDPYSAASIVGQ